MIKYIGIFIGGLGIGGLVTWGLVRKHYELIAEDEIADMRDFYEKKYKSTEKREKRDDGPSEASQRDIENMGNTLRSYGKTTSEAEKAKMAYNLKHGGARFSEKTGESELIDEEDDGVETDEEREEREAAYDNETMQTSNEPPYVITLESFSDEFPHHDKINITYFAEDEVLCDEGEVVMDDPNYYIGPEALRMLEGGAPNVWVRNERIGIDYEIILVNNSYAQVILGYGGR